MTVQQLIDRLSFIPSNYKVMVKVGDSERDLITGIGSINCVNSKKIPPSGFIELETCNAIDWRHKESDNRSRDKRIDVLDKIGAEIDELYSYVEFDEDLKTSFNMVRLEEVQKVIDKYKGENK